MDARQIGGVILSAGRSTRQSGFKPILRIGPHTALEHCLRLFQTAGLAEVVVVLGHRAEDLFPVVRAANARPVINSDYLSGMFSSVQIGAAAVSDAAEAFFVLPVDIPLVRADTIDVLCRSLLRHPAADVLVPVFGDRAGHPPLIRSALRNRIAAHEGSGGLRGLLNSVSRVLVPVDDPNILVDIDTPAQYRQACALWENGFRGKV